MLTQPIRKTFDIGDGRQVTIETGRLARQADGAVTVTIGNCIILATVVANREPKEGQDFFPLSVDYMEKFGRIITWTTRKNGFGFIRVGSDGLSTRGSRYLIVSVYCSRNLFGSPSLSRFGPLYSMLRQLHI